jgi:hypothetical protein
MDEQKTEKQEWQPPKLVKLEPEGTKMDYTGWYSDGFDLEILS